MVTNNVHFMFVFMFMSLSSSASPFVSPPLSLTLYISLFVSHLFISHSYLHLSIQVSPLSLTSFLDSFSPLCLFYSVSFLLPFTCFLLLCYFPSPESLSLCLFSSVSSPLYQPLSLSSWIYLCFSSESFSPFLSLHFYSWSVPLSIPLCLFFLYPRSFVSLLALTLCPFRSISLLLCLSPLKLALVLFYFPSISLLYFSVSSCCFPSVSIPLFVVFFSIQWPFPSVSPLMSLPCLSHYLSSASQLSLSLNFIL